MENTPPATLQRKTKVVIYTKQPRTNMKIEYKVWTCLGCKKSVQITKSDALWIPRWINVQTEGSSSSSDNPSYNCSVCSTACLSKAGILIQELIDKKEGYSIPCKKEIIATICDRCGKVAKIDLLNPLIGPGPLRGWSHASRGEKDFDFCSIKCEDDHFSTPEESVFFGLEFPTPSHKEKRLLKAIDAPNFRDSIRAEEAQLLFGTKPPSPKLSRKAFGNLVKAIEISQKSGRLKKDIENTGQ